MRFQFCLGKGVAFPKLWEQTGKILDSLIFLTCVKVLERIGYVPGAAGVVEIVFFHIQSKVIFGKERLFYQTENKRNEKIAKTAVIPIWVQCLGRKYLADGLADKIKIGRSFNYDPIYCPI